MREILVGVAIAVLAPALLGSFGWLRRRLRDARAARAAADGEVGADDASRTNFIESGVFPNRDFVGRRDVLALLHSMLRDGGVAIAQAVTGLGGVGKTETAKAYAFAHRDEYDGCWWIDASRPTIAASAGRLARSLGVKAEREAGIDTLGPALCERLSAGRHLLILDNLDEPEHLAHFRLMGDSRALVTTRRTLLPRHMVSAIDLDVLERSESVEILRRARAGLVGPGAEACLDAIAEWLGDHALALAFAAEYLRAYQDVGLDELLEKLRGYEIRDDASLFEGISELQVGARSRLSVAKSLGLYLPSFEGTDAMKIIGVLAYCQPDDVPLDLLQKATQLKREPLRRWLRKLADVSILKYGKHVSIHRLTQLAVRAQLDPASRESTKAALRSAVASQVLEFSSFVDLSWDERAAYAAQAEASVYHARTPDLSGPEAEQTRMVAQRSGAPPNRDLRLRVYAGDEAGKVFLVQHQSTLIGRSDTCDIQLPDPRVSRLHAELVWEGGAIVVASLSETNPVLVNGQEVRGARSLRLGDQIQLGITILELEAGPLDAIAASESAGAPGPTAESSAELEPSLRQRMEERLSLDRDVEEEFSTSGIFVDVDVVSSHQMKQGAQRVEDVVISFERLRAFVSLTTEEFGGFVLNSNGDELMLFFEDASNSVEASRAMLARLDTFNRLENLLAEPFRIRIGAHAGRSLVDRKRGVAYSPVLDVTGHLQKAADVNGILVSAELLALLPEGLPFEPAGRLEREGIDTYRLIETRS